MSSFQLSLKLFEHIQMTDTMSRNSSKSTQSLTPCATQLRDWEKIILCLAPFQLGPKALNVLVDTSVLRGRC